MSPNVFGKYKNFVWWTMDIVGVSRSIQSKVLMAVAIQFAVSVSLAIVPTVFSGWLRLWSTVCLFGLATVAFANTVLVVQDDLIKPILNLQRTSEQIADGHLNVSPPKTDQQDEMGRLVRSFGEMCDYLGTVANQAEAIADREFDAPVIEEDVPGRFGRALQEMTASLQRYIARIENDRDRFQLLNYLVGHDVPNLINIIAIRLDMLRETGTEQDEKHLDIIEEQIEEIDDISHLVGSLASAESVRPVDVKKLLAHESGRIDESFPDAAVSLDLPDGAVYVTGNDLFGRVFENLIVNGIEHNDRAEPHVEVTMRVNDGVDITITDNGPGIDFADAGEVFATAETGTGLDIVETIIGWADGSITVTETSDDGTTVELWLPTTEPPESQTDDAKWLENVSTEN